MVCRCSAEAAERELHTLNRSPGKNGVSTFLFFPPKRKKTPQPANPRADHLHHLSPSGERPGGCRVPPGAGHGRVPSVLEGRMEGQREGERERGRDGGRRQPRGPRGLRAAVSQSKPGTGMRAAEPQRPQHPPTPSPPPPPPPLHRRRPVGVCFSCF